METIGSGSVVLRGVVLVNVVSRYRGGGYGFGAGVLLSVGARLT